jgi:hypothetical protein
VEEVVGGRRGLKENSGGNGLHAGWVALKRYYRIWSRSLIGDVNCKLGRCHKMTASRRWYLMVRASV